MTRLPAPSVHELEHGRWVVVRSQWGSTKAPVSSFDKEFLIKMICRDVEWEFIDNPNQEK